MISLKGVGGGGGNWIFTDFSFWISGGLGFETSGLRGSEVQCRNLIKKPWAFIRVPYMNPTILGL